MRALRTATTGMAAQQMNVEVISNNIANMNTIGFKKQRAEFQDLIYQNVERMGAQSSDSGTVVPTGIQIGSGVKTGSVYRIMEQGSATLTGNDYDVAFRARAISRSCCRRAKPPIRARATSRPTIRAASSPRTAIWSSRTSPSRRARPA